MAVERQEVKVSARDLQVGMRIVRLDRAWIETNFLLEGFVVENQQDIDSVISQCEYVFVEERKEILIQVKTPTYLKNTSHQKKRIYLNQCPVESEVGPAKKSYSIAKGVVNNMMESVRTGKMIDMGQNRSVVDNIVDSILRNDEALIWLTKLKNKDEYTAEHSVNVCILTVAFARYLGMSGCEIKSIGLCALLHDIGKAKISIEILNKPSSLSEEEYAVMKQHPAYGRTLLESLPEPNQSCVDVVYSHHEREDGSGYPLGLKADQISYSSKIIALTDTYDAITSNRVYDAGRASMEALDIIYRLKDSKYNKSLALEFIKCIGIYPAGTMVEMTNGEVGVILSHHSNKKLKPKIVLLLDYHKNKCEHKIIDLQNRDLDLHGNCYSIACEIPSEKYGLDVKRFLNQNRLF